MMEPDLDGALRVFTVASTYMAHPDRVAEVDWQRGNAFSEFTETDVLREAAWVILCSGFRERIVRRVFDHVSLCFCDWESASAIVNSDPNCRIAAMASFRNIPKLDAIVGSARHIQECGFATFKEAVQLTPIAELSRLPYIGPITVWHLAKNLGLDVAKPDRHLARISVIFGFENAHHLCTEVSRSTGEQRKVVDLIMWRYLAEQPHALIKSDIAAA